MENPQDLLKGLRTLVQNNEADQALEQLSAFLEERSSDLLDEALSLTQQLNHWEQKMRLNLIDHKEYGVAFSNVCFGTLRLITQTMKEVQGQSAQQISAGVAMSDLGLGGQESESVSGDPLLQSGQKKYEDGDYAGALSDFSAAAAKNPSLPEARLLQAMLYGELGMPTEALQFYNETLRLDPQNAVALNNRGLIQLESLENYPAALKDFDAALKTDPALTTARFNRALVNMNLEQFENAIRDLDACIKLKTQSEQAFGLRGVCKARLHDYEGSKADLNIALQYEPDNSTYISTIGLNLYNQGEYAACIPHFDRSLEINPNQPETQNLRGISHYFLENYAVALSDFDQVIRTAPDNAYAWFFKGCCEKALGQTAHAEASLKQAISVSPGMAEPYAILGVLYYEAKNYDLSITFCQSALALDDDQSVALQYLELAKAAKIKPDIGQSILGFFGLKS